MDNRLHRRRWRIPVLGGFAGGLAYALLQMAAFGHYTLLHAPQSSERLQG